MATVETLVTAASQVLERHGLAQFSTTAVAERAGVSIGTLYQYFANRDDMLLAIARRELRRALQGLASEYSSAPQGQRARRLVRAILQTFRDAPAGRQAALNLTFRYLSRGELVSEVRSFTVSLAEHLAGERNLTDEQAFVLSRAVLGVASAALSERYELDEQSLEDQLVLLIMRYLEPVEAG